MAIKIDLRQTDISRFEHEKNGEEQTIQFSIKGAVHNVDEEVVREAFEAQRLQPVEIELETGTSG